MTYNERHFSQELNLQLSHKLDSLIVWQNHALDFQIKYLVAVNGQTQLTNCSAFIQLLAKTRFNLDAANNLLRLLYDDYRFKTSVNVIYRAIVDDIINSYYLFGTVALADPEQHALGNELTIFHKEFILSSIKGINSEREFEKYIDELNEVESSPDIDVEDEFKRANADLFTAAGAWKKNSEIRANTSPYFIDLFNQTDGNGKGFISEAKKLEFIKARGVVTHSNIAAMFKYLSQFQHFSPKSHELLNSHIEYDIVIYQRCLGELVMLLDQLFQVLELQDKAELQSEWKALAPLIFNSFNE